MADRSPDKASIRLTYINICYKMIFASGCSSVWYERYVGDVEAAGSNPVTPTIMKIKAFRIFEKLFVYREHDSSGRLVSNLNFFAVRDSGNSQRSSA